MKNETYIVEITEDLVGGLKKGVVKAVPKRVYDRLIKEGQAVESDEKSLQAYSKKRAAEKKAEFENGTRKLIKETNKKARKPLRNIRRNNNANSGGGNEVKTYKEVDEHDFEPNPFLKEQGVKVGDHLEYADDAFVLDADGKVIKKPEGAGK